MYRMQKLSVGTIGVVSSLLLCTGCAKTTPATDFESTVGKTATINVLTFSAAQKPANRLSAPLGIFTSLYLSTAGGVVNVQSAVTGVQGQMKLHSEPPPTSVDDTYQLLQDFASVMKADIPDMLNRSDDRPRVLNEYVEGLTNITDRGQIRLREINERIQILKQEQKQAQSENSSLEKEIKKSLSAGDYAAAAEQQKAQIDVQTRLNEVTSDLKLQTTLGNNFNTLITVSARRLQAINENREILVSGLKAVNIPGVEDLKVIDDVKSNQRGLGISIF